MWKKTKQMIYLFDSIEYDSIINAIKEQDMTDDNCCAENFILYSQQLRIYFCCVLNQWSYFVCMCVCAGIISLLHSIFIPIRRYANNQNLFTQKWWNSSIKSAVQRIYSVVFILSAYFLFLIQSLSKCFFVRWILLNFSDVQAWLILLLFAIWIEISLKLGNINTYNHSC